ncbi:porin [Rahnella victoriana]|uniref:YfaZ family outer membrane protein n=1 Tax=Rahnella victoriana TaxID=1510570 RepID=UPI000BB181B7|nr:YfaZ family outer membrane protein [Rahnella victoriana]PBI80447.1 porin [Rahnella victoriana]
MKLVKVGCLMAALLATGSANAVSIHGEAGQNWTDLGVSFGANDPGLTFGGNWAHSEDDGDIAGINLGLNLPLGPVLFTMGGKALYLSPDDGDDGYAIAIGGGAQLPLGEHFTVFGDAYYSPDSLSSGVKEYVEANAGVRWKVIPLMSVEAGYRYVDMAGKHGRRDNTIADGAYAGVNFNF